MQLLYAKMDCINILSCLLHQSWGICSITFSLNVIWNSLILSLININELQIRSCNVKQKVLDYIWLSSNIHLLI